MLLEQLINDAEDNPVFVESNLPGELNARANGLFYVSPGVEHTARYVNGNAASLLLETV